MKQKKSFLVKNKNGLHARPASAVVRLLRRVLKNISTPVDIFFSYNGETANAKSIMELLTLTAVHGAVIEVTVITENNSIAKTILKELQIGFDNRFEEA